MYYVCAVDIFLFYKYCSRNCIFTFHIKQTAEDCKVDFPSVCFSFLSIFHLAYSFLLLLLFIFYFHFYWLFGLLASIHSISRFHSFHRFSKSMIFFSVPRIYWFDFVILHSNAMYEIVFFFRSLSLIRSNLLSKNFLIMDMRRFAEKRISKEKNAIECEFCCSDVNFIQILGKPLWIFGIFFIKNIFVSVQINALQLYIDCSDVCRHLPTDVAWIWNSNDVKEISWCDPCM